MNSTWACVDTYIKLLRAIVTKLYGVCVQAMMDVNNARNHMVTKRNAASIHG